MKYRPKTKPDKYQSLALKRAFQCDVRYGLFIPPGGGKTKLGIDTASALYQQGKIRKVLVLCQKTGHPVWREQLKTHAPVKYRLETLLGSSRARVGRLKALRPSRDSLLFVLLNYESVWRIEEAVFRWKPDLIICDEGHKLKNRNAKQTKAVLRLIQVLDPYRLLMTGTHIANSPLDIFSQYMVIDDSVFGRRWKPFSDRYARFHGFFKQHVRYVNLPDLRRRARSRATVLTEEELNLGLKKPRAIEIPVSLEPKAQAIYNLMDEEFMTWLDDNRKLDEDNRASAAIVLTKILRLQQIGGGFLRTDDGVIRQVSTAKLEALDDKLEEIINAGEKAVVFAVFRPEVEAIEALCKKRRWKCFKYYGQKTAKAKREMLEYPFKFSKTKGPAVFVAQVATGALSIDLTASCYGIFYSWDVSRINWEQCHKRIHRRNQKRRVTYYYLVAENTRDHIILDAQVTKKKLSTVLDNLPLLKLS